jgi:hypothetical protein
VRLFHVSEEPDIARFEPRPAADGVLKIWAIEERTFCNYLLPRDCPRVCFRATPGVDASLLEGAEAIVAIEAGWLARVQTTALHRYEMPADDFALEDRIAGYWTSISVVTPLSVTALTDLPTRIAEAGARLVVLPTLWPLHDRVKTSGLDFSMIRMRNAAPRG